MKRHIKRNGRVGITYRNALCGLPERYADLGHHKGSVYSLDTYQKVPVEQICRTCHKIARNR